MPPAKAVKTERTHEENQERAYIAASRRSDRSLEARVESARRASEIHKRRTGRSLRVTEQDVINEEMYEEEDDDLPMQYRRLAAYLTTNNADFNRRLNDYLTSHVAMRSALANSYGQPLSMPDRTTSMFPSPMLAHQPQQQVAQPPMQTMGSTSYRQQPYPPPYQKNNQQSRSLSIAIPQDLPSSGQPGNQSNERRFSTPAAPAAKSPVGMTNPTSATSDKPRPSFPHGSFAQLGKQQRQAPSAVSSLPPYDHNPGGNNKHTYNNSYSPFSTALPAESQMFLGSTLDYSDPLSSLLMAGADHSQIYDFNTHAQPEMQQLELNKQHAQQNYTGLNSTLAPSAGKITQASQVKAEEDIEQPSYDSHQSFFDQAFSNTPGGTPGVNGESWGSFIDTSLWATPSSSQQ
ncbi:hypothetical protein BJ878DRAFT_175853 [Calycina marina]|uniref:Uncharacterized protein n=1 Tax=Calycina marina TaxID=1763456 RepID=A0A9P7YZ22_9HELO|nr:hypothetical protein BJ878DRAFT_175853 [Calycina marina]